MKPIAPIQTSGRDGLKFVTSKPTRSVMLFNEYIPLAMRTMSPHSPTGKWEVDYMIHALFGITTELKELAEATSDLNRAEELGDICWFTAAIVKACGIEGYSQDHMADEAWLKEDVYDAELEILNITTAMMNVMKKQLFYGPSVNLDRWSATVALLKPLASSLVEVVDSTIILHGHVPMKIRVLNIAKLSKRYADKFSDQEANIRNINAEYEAMGAK